MLYLTFKGWKVSGTFVYALLCTHYELVESVKYVIPFGLVVRISGSHPGGPGSIPGMGTIFYIQILVY